MNWRWVLLLLLIAIGYYFGKYAGAITLLLLYYFAFRTKKETVQRPLNPATSVQWAYRVLEIPPHASNDAVKKARKKCLNHYHPDKLSSTASAQEKQRACDKINEINRAYQAIMQTRKHDEK